MVGMCSKYMYCVVLCLPRLPLAGAVQGEEGQSFWPTLAPGSNVSCFVSAVLRVLTVVVDREKEIEGKDARLPEHNNYDGRNHIGE